MTRELRDLTTYDLTSYIDQSVGGDEDLSNAPEDGGDDSPND